MFMSGLNDHKKEYDPKEIFESKFKKTLIHCPNPECGKPIGKRQGNTWWIRQINNGKTVETKIEMSPASGSSYKMSCTYCGFGHIFAVISDNITVE